jgi:hypothetical protein
MFSQLQSFIDVIRFHADRCTPLRLRSGGVKDFLDQSLQCELSDTTA